MKLEEIAQPIKALELELGITGEQGGMDADSLIRSFLFHLGCTLAKDQYTATNQDRYQALALAVRDRLVGRWIQTQQAYHKQNVKRICYLSLEFLIGRAMGNNVINLLLEDTCREAMGRSASTGTCCATSKSDAALGNGGLGRLAACFLELDGDAEAAGDRLRHPLRLRHLQAAHRQRLPGRGAGQLAALRQSVGSRPPRAVVHRQLRGTGRAAPARTASRTGTGSAPGRSSASPTTRRSSATARSTSTICGSGRHAPPTNSTSAISAAAPMSRRSKTS